MTGFLSSAWLYVGASGRGGLGSIADPDRRLGRGGALRVAGWAPVGLSQYIQGLGYVYVELLGRRRA